ncbi:MAG: hypothetical protein R2867_27275 [Caldilineaceae bacterium]
MLTSNKQIEWHFLEGGSTGQERSDEFEWESLINNEDDGRNPSFPEFRRLYELLFACVLICSIVVYYLWQQTEERLLLLEQEIATLQSEIIKHQSVSNGSILSRGSLVFEPTKLPGEELVQTIRSREIKPQWDAMTTAAQLYLQLENGDNRNWRLHPALLQRRYLAQSRSIDLVQQMIMGWQAETTDQVQLSPTAYAVADPLIEFIFETYGVDQILLLLDAFAVYDTWETLAPAVFYASAGEFEEDWHQYLRQQYPLPDE